MKRKVSESVGLQEGSFIRGAALIDVESALQDPSNVVNLVRKVRNDPETKQIG